MTTQDISNPKVAGNVIDETWYNDFRAVVKQDFVPRNTGAVVQNLGGSLGTALFNWDKLFINELFINNTLIDLGNLTGGVNGILSGRVRNIVPLTSKFPDFIRANGNDSFTILAVATNLILKIGGGTSTYTTDIVEGSLTPAPTTNNTCQVNEPGLSGGQASKTLGENGTVINIDSAGSEITNRIGQYVLLKRTAGNEYLLAYVSSSSLLTNVYRGYLFDTGGLPINREELSDNNTLTLMSTGWIFAQNDSTTIDVSYRSPIVSEITPTSPVIGDYWFDRNDLKWKRFNGSIFEIVNRLLIGIAAIDGVNCTGTRSFAFDKSFNDFNPVDLKFVDSNNIITNRTDDFTVSIYGENVFFRHTSVKWIMPASLETSQSEQSNTIYYVYLTDTGQQILSDIRPYDQRGVLGGFYHPHNSWRSVGSILNDGSSNFEAKSLTRTSLGTAAFLNVGTNENEVLQLDNDKKVPAVDGSQITNLSAGQIGSLIDRQEFNSNGSWTKASVPNLKNSSAQVLVEVWGGGGSGDRRASNSATAGGGGGSYKSGWFQSSSLPSSVPIVIGIGGAAITAGNGEGNNGTESIFNVSLPLKPLVGYGGSGGSISFDGGAAGGIFSNTISSNVNDTGTGEGAGGVFPNNSGIPGYFIGGGGGNSSTGNGGSSVYGGGGGAGVTNDASGNGGTSIFGGNGGTVEGQAGSIPSGGGAPGVGVNSGAGANGRVIVTTFNI